MSMTAEEIKDECAARLDREDDVSDTQLYNWMNRAKRRVQTDGDPLDFMAHKALVVSGSGTGTPGEDDDHDGSKILLPYNFVSAVRLGVFGLKVTAADMNRLFGDVDLPLYWAPSSGSVGSGVTGDHSGADIMPLFTVDTGLLVAELSDRGMDWDFEVGFSAAVKEGLAISDLAGRAAVPDRKDQRGVKPDFVFYVDDAGGNISITDTESAIESTHALGAWTSKVLQIDEEWSEVANFSEGEGVIAQLEYYRWLPDYNSPNPETRLGNLATSYVTEDIFTRKHEELLIYGALWQAHEYLDNVREAMRYREMYNEESRRCRSHHLRSQSRSLRRRQRIKRGAKVIGNELL